MRSQVFAASRADRPRIRTKLQRPNQLLAVEREGEPALLHAGARIVDRRPRPVVPHDDAAAAVLALRDDALEIGVLEPGGSSFCTASRFSAGSRLGPFGTAQLLSVPSCSRRKS
jgi:hypothetical protein